ncbi:Mu-like prophage major head subunit gpT family protein [Kiloniella litopenaei]|uniref:Mu-like prophage major head subunit gpT family protein n=1 Tax=Kiloniella litopenaei TaxID=1549748 RepID=UPI003BA977B6
MLINAKNMETLYTGFKTSFNHGFRSSTPQWQEVATMVPSTTAQELYAWLGQFPRMREWIGDRQIKKMSGHTYTIKNKKFESTISVERDAIDDDAYGIYSPLFQELGLAAATHPDELVYAMLADGFNKHCYDGQYFFDSDHPVLVNDQETSVTNMHPGAETPWFLMDTRRALKPLIFQKRRDYDLKRMDDAKDENVFMRDQYLYGVDARCNVGFGFWQLAFGSKATLDKAAFRDARTRMMSQKSDEGRPLGVVPNVMIVGPGQSDAARDVILAEKTNGGDTNTDRNLVKIIEVPWLV